MAEPSTDPEINFDLAQPPPAEKRPMRVESFGLTDQGRIRETNEDQFLIAELRKAMHIRQSSVPQSQTRQGDERGYLFLVADGMGGHRAGERASAMAVEAIEEFALNTLKWFFHLQGPEEPNVLADFQAALRHADLRVYEESEARPDRYGMGTTLTLAYALSSDLYVAHVGDSRCYLFGNGKLFRLTQDHTLASEMVRHGALTPEQAARHHFRHVITNVVGGRELGITVETHKIRLGSGDVMLLCSDGLTEMVTEEQIALILQGQPDLQRACEQLIRAANDAGGKDNVTVVMARFLAAD